MEILGIGPLELAMIAALALILMGPKDMAKAGKTIGKWLNNFVKSETWQVLRDTTKTVRNLPTQLMREANFEEAQKGSPAAPARPKNEEMDAVAKAPAQNYAPRRSNPEPGELDKTILAPARSQPVAEPAPPPPAAAPTGTDATLIEANPKTSAGKPKKPATSSKSVTERKSAKKPAEKQVKSKRGKKPNA